MEHNDSNSSPKILSEESINGITKDFRRFGKGSPSEILELLKQIKTYLLENVPYEISLYDDKPKDIATQTTNFNNTNETTQTIEPSTENSKKIINIIGFEGSLEQENDKTKDWLETISCSREILRKRYVDEVEDEDLWETYSCPEEALCTKRFKNVISIDNALEKLPESSFTLDISRTGCKNYISFSNI